MDVSAQILKLLKMTENLNKSDTVKACAQLMEMHDHVKATVILILDTLDSLYRGISGFSSYQEKDMIDNLITYLDYFDLFVEYTSRRESELKANIDGISYQMELCQNDLTTIIEAFLPREKYNSLYGILNILPATPMAEMIMYHENEHLSIRRDVNNIITILKNDYMRKKDMDATIMKSVIQGIVESLRYIDTYYEYEKKRDREINENVNYFMIRLTKLYNASIRL